MKHCKACTILEKYDPLNAAGYCSWCVARGYEKRGIVTYVPEEPKQNLKNAKGQPTTWQLQTLLLMSQNSDIAAVAKAQGTSVSNVRGKIRRMSKGVGVSVCRWKNGRAYELTPEGEALLDRFS